MSKVYWSISLNSVWALREIASGKTVEQVLAQRSGRELQGLKNTLARLQQRGMIWDYQPGGLVELTAYGAEVCYFLSRLPKGEDANADIPGDAGAIARMAHSVSDQP